MWIDREAVFKLRYKMDGQVIATITVPDKDAHRVSKALFELRHEEFGVVQNNIPKAVALAKKRGWKVKE